VRAQYARTPRPGTAKETAHHAPLFLVLIWEGIAVILPLRGQENLMQSKIVLIRNCDDPPDDRVVTFAVQNGFEPVFLRPFKGDTPGLPGPDVACSVVYGGPCNVFEEDRHPFPNDKA
jgi:hypothetical protein